MKKILFGILGCILIAIIFYVGNYINLGEKSSKTPVQNMDTAMGTIVSQTVYAEDATVICKEVLETIRSLERDSISWREETAELYLLNAGTGEETLSNKMQEILERCLELSERSEGAFDITIGPVVRLWNIDAWAGKENSTEYLLPEREELANLLQVCGYEQLEIKEGILHMPEGMQLDLGAVGKGIALDEIRNYLEQKQEVSAVISVGGSILTYGTKPDGKLWRVGIVNPMQTSDSIGHLELGGGWCVSTSGDYERYVEVNGVRYHHIIDPHTGYPANNGVKGVTILSASGLLSDAMSTACFILGEEKGLALAEQVGVEALFVRGDGSITMTEGMKSYFHLSKQ